MDTHDGQVVPYNDNPIPTLAELTQDPEIAALLDFEPVPRKLNRVGGWDADAQRAFIAQLAITGSRLHAAKAVGGRSPGGIDRLLKDEGADSFRAAYHAATELHAERNGDRLAQGVAEACRADPHAQAPGQVMNEYGEWEDEHSFRERGEEAEDRIGDRLVRIRRLYLAEISADAGKRAAFEILTEYPIDWDVAAAGKPQEFEPWMPVNQRQPDMVLMAESGWTAGEIGYGPDRKAEARRVLDEQRAERGLEPLAWSE